MPWIFTRKYLGVDEYWTGRTDRDGHPERTLFRHEAKHFSGASAAYQAADTHRDLRNSDSWRVVKR